MTHQRRNQHRQPQEKSQKDLQRALRFLNNKRLTHTLMIIKVLSAKIPTQGTEKSTKIWLSLLNSRHLLNIPTDKASKHVG